MKRLALGFALALAVVPVLAQQGGPRAVMGRVTAKGDKSIDIEARQRGQGGGQATQVQMKVNLEDATKYAKMEQATAADLVVGAIVAVAGAKEGAKVTATSVCRVAEKGALDEPTQAIARSVARGRGQRGGAQQQPPTVGTVSSTNPLKVKTADGEVEVAMGEQARISKLTACTLADIPAQGFVTVIPKAAPQDNAVTAVAVLSMGQMGGRRGGGNR